MTHGTSVKLEKGTMSIRQGTEGPRHDPYGYTEFRMRWDDNSRSDTVLHEGALTTHFVEGTERETDEVRARELFETKLGMTTQEIWERVWLQRDACEKCGSNNIEEGPGHIGETIYMCADCGTIVASEQNYSAIE